jgi:hypothetical protein
VPCNRQGGCHISLAHLSALAPKVEEQLLIQPILTSHVSHDAFRGEDRASRDLDKGGL